MRTTIAAIGTTVALAALFTAPSPLAYVNPGRPNCPQANEKNSWAKYINGDYGDKRPVPYFSVHFSRDIGDIAGGTCYTIIFDRANGWTASGTVRSARGKRSAGHTSQGGDPLKYQMNVWGARFTFNEAGEVYYDADGKLSGQMYCRIGSECWK